MTQALTHPPLLQIKTCPHKGNNNNITLEKTYIACVSDDVDFVFVFCGACEILPRAVFCLSWFLFVFSVSNVPNLLFFIEENTILSFL